LAGRAHSSGKGIESTLLPPPPPTLSFQLTADFIFKRVNHIQFTIINFHSKIKIKFPGIHTLKCEYFITKNDSNFTNINTPAYLIEFHFIYIFSKKFKRLNILKNIMSTSSIQKGGFGNPSRRSRITYSSQFPFNPIENRSSNNSISSHSSSNSQNLSLINEKTERLDIYLKSHFGSFQNKVSTINLINKHLKTLELKNSTDNKIITDHQGISFEPAKDLLIFPGQSLIKFWRQKGNPIMNENLPVLVKQGGIVGSSSKSIKKQQFGWVPWRYGDRHLEYFPLQNVYVIFKQKIHNTNQPESILQTISNLHISSETKQEIVKYLNLSKSYLEKAIQLLEEQQPSSSNTTPPNF